MKKMKSVLLATIIMLCAIVSVKVVNKRALIGYAVSKNASAAHQTFAVAAYGGLGAWAGAEYGATLGSFGGPVGTVIGGAVGAL